MARTTGCQLAEPIVRLLQYKPLTNKEVDALQRRLFAYEDILDTHNITLQDIRDIRTKETKDYFMSYLRNTINKLTPTEAIHMFY